MSKIPVLVGAALMAGVAVVLSSAAVSARAGGEPQHSVGGGHIPAHGPARVPTTRPAMRLPQPNRPTENHGPAGTPDRAGHPIAPHVHGDTDTWIGHDTGRDDAHYHLDHHWEHGHFPGNIGPHHI